MRRADLPDTSATHESSGMVTLEVYGYELANGVSWLEVTPFVLRELAEIGHKQASDEEKLASLTFELGEHHPLYEAIPEPPLYRLDRHDHYAFYVRVPDLPEFLRHIAPVLERRLAASVAAGHTGEVKVSFYGGGLRLELERGQLSRVEHWSPTVEECGDAAFPDLTFLQLLFGHRSLEELDHAFADCSPGEGDSAGPARCPVPQASLCTSGPFAEICARVLHPGNRRNDLLPEGLLAV